MKTAILAFAAALGLSVITTGANAEPFVFRPHYIHERQFIPERTTNYETYYLRKNGRLPPFSRAYVAPAEPVMPPGYRWSDVYVPGYGYVPQDVIGR